MDSNHEMCTGGHAYYGTTLKQFEQQSSCFAAQNANWTLIGLDTAYVEHDLSEAQVEWVRQVVAQADQRRVILLSHHQPFSRLDGQGPKLHAKLDQVLSQRRIYAWYWGHEHRCVLYDRHPSWGIYGRCIGHSGYPYFRDDFASATLVASNASLGAQWYRLEESSDSPGCIVLDGPNPYLGDRRDHYGPNGYLTLEFTPASLTEVVHAPNGIQKAALPLK